MCTRSMYLILVTLANALFAQYALASQKVNTDYNGDGVTDIAFHSPGSGWVTVPVLLSNGYISRDLKNLPAPSWANQSGVKAVTGDFDGDGELDIAFYKPGGGWNTVPVLLSNGDGSWRSRNNIAPSWANQPDVEAITGDFDASGTTDIAFYRPGGGWNTVPVLLSNGDGSWRSRNKFAPRWANQPNVKVLVGMFNSDMKSDLAFYRPGGGWNTIPVLFSNGDGTWQSSNKPVPDWASHANVKALTGNFNNDRYTDIVFHQPRSHSLSAKRTFWNSIPVLFANGDGTWGASNEPAPFEAN